MSFIELMDISKTFYRGKNEIKALNNINLEISSGDFVSIMGKSGCGKTTLLNVIAGIEKADTGRYIYDGTNVGELNQRLITKFRCNNISLVVQHFALIPNYTLLENVALPLRYKHVKPAERKEKAKKLIAKLGLQGQEKAYPKELSGGQCQRVAIARAIIPETPVILADEPTGELDSVTGAEIMSILKSINEQGVTIIIVTHDNSIKKYCNKNYEMHDGKILLPK